MWKNEIRSTYNGKQPEIGLASKEYCVNAYKLVQTSNNYCVKHVDSCVASKSYCVEAS